MQTVQAITYRNQITEEMILKEFLRMGMEELIAADLSKRYYHNNLTYKDLEYLESNFNLKFEMLVERINSLENNFNVKFERLEDRIDGVEKRLEDKINSVESNFNLKLENVKIELDNKIDNVRSELKSDIKELDNKIDTKFNELDNKIDKVEDRLHAIISANNLELRSELKFMSKISNWMFGSVISLIITILAILLSQIFNK
ncbi:Bdr family repetitive protein [Borrelia venezuelensis]|uniref:Bdr family repetitive protein n=1 Tax=Borrelia venezuelensis TaxID=1653839 RepID=UPI001FF4F699|nr:Bdr family repetitive protein [Borrelia venezuelensis]